MAMTNITQNKKAFNEFTWGKLTAGKLMCIHHMAKAAWLAGESLAHDLLHEIENFDYENPDAQLYIVKHEHTALVNA